MCCWIGRMNIVKMSITPNTIYRFNIIFIKLPMAFFTESQQKKMLNLCGDTDPEQPEQSWEKKNGAEEIRFPGFRLYYQATVIKTVWYWHKNRNIDQWNRTENPEIKPCAYGQFIYDKGGNTAQWWKDNLFNKWCRENWRATRKKMKLDYFSTPYTHTKSSKWIKDLNMSRTL